MLVGKRKGSHAAGLISFPGGHLDWWETWSECALRELGEECGTNLKVRIRPFNDHRTEFFVTNDIMDKYQKHYVTLFLVSDWIEGEAENLEPHKCDGWEWIDFNQLKNQVCADWIPIDLIESYRTQIGI